MAADVELARALERGEVPPGGFHHADHLRVALVYLDESASADEALARMGGALRRFAASVGRPEKYSQATTAFWVHQLAAARALLPGATADVLFRRCPRLLDKDFVTTFAPSAPPRP